MRFVCERRAEPRSGKVFVAQKERGIDAVPHHRGMDPALLKGFDPFVLVLRQETGAEGSDPRFPVIAWAAAALSPVRRTQDSPSRWSALMAAGAFSRMRSERAIRPAGTVSKKTKARVAPSAIIFFAASKSAGGRSSSLQRLTRTRTPEMSVSPPAPACIRKSETGSSLPPRAFQALQIAFPKGCSESCSASAA